MKTPDCNQDAMAGFAAPYCSASLPPVLDACCGARKMWYDRKDPRAIFVDRRTETHEYTHKDRDGVYTLEISPDIQCDFTDLPFPSESFALVAFDPPHLTSLGERSYTALSYGRLEGDWRDMLRKGFAECFRVLKPHGTLIFKWNEYDVPIKDILALTPERPLFGQRRGKEGRTHWVAFLKPNVEVSDSRP